MLLSTAEYNMVLQLPGINATNVNLTKVDYGNLDENLCEQVRHVLDFLRARACVLAYTLS